MHVQLFGSRDGVLMQFLTSMLGLWGSSPKGGGRAGRVHEVGWSGKVDRMAPRGLVSWGRGKRVDGVTLVPFKKLISAKLRCLGKSLQLHSNF